MKKSLIYLFSMVAALSMAACTEIEDGVNDIDSWEKPRPVYDPVTYDLSKHPCMLHTATDIEYVKQHLGQTPWAEAYQMFLTSGFCDASRTAHPWEKLARLNPTNWPTGGGRWTDAGLTEYDVPGIQNSYMDLARDAATAYQLALKWQLSGDSDAAQAAISILDSWASVNTGMLLGKNKWKDDVIDSNEYLIMFQIHHVANAAELLRDYNNWGNSTGFSKVVDWLTTHWYPFCHKFLEINTGDHWWMNWDLASMTAILSIGILAEDNDMVNEAILRFKSSDGPGCITGKGVLNFSLDPSGTGEMLAQGNEAGRDQGHNTLCAVLMGYFCQMAYNIGEDLFSFEDGRAIAFAQYVAKYNLPKEGISNPTTDAGFQYSESSMPFTEYTYSGSTMSAISSADRGHNRPGWDIWAGYCQQHAVKATYINEYAERYRPDGGCGHYGTNSGGFDQIGFSTLMFYRPAQN